MYHNKPAIAIFKSKTVWSLGCVVSDEEVHEVEVLVVLGPLEGRVARDVPDVWVRAVLQQQSHYVNVEVLREDVKVGKIKMIGNFHSRGIKTSVIHHNNDKNDPILRP